MHSLVQPNSWIALRLPSDVTRVFKILPDKTISLGKYGSFPSNLIIQRPYHLTYEILDKKEGEGFSRLRVVPTAELYAEVLAEEAACGDTPDNNESTSISATEKVEYKVVDEEGKVVDVLDENARQTLTQEEIEELKRDGSGAGKELIKKLLLSHNALDQKTSFSLAKYKLLKTKKYIRRFQVLPVDVHNFAKWQLEERDASKILDLREEMLGLVGCWGNVHYGGDDVYLEDPGATGEQGEEMLPKIDEGLLAGRWLVVDDTCGVLVAALAERMGFLYPEEEDDESKSDGRVGEESEAAPEQAPTAVENGKIEAQDDQKDTEMADATTQEQQPPAEATTGEAKAKQHKRGSDFAIPFSQTNTITVVHGATQPNLSFLTHWGFDVTAPNHPPHPLLNHLLTLSWLQLLNPTADTTYSTPPLTASPETLLSWKPGRRGNFHRKRRRFARTRHIVDTARAGGFSGLVCASTMDPISILKHTLPLLAGGAPVAIYSPTLEPLAQLADCFSVSRRGAWASGMVPEILDKTAEELERWAGTEDFPLNPTLLLGTSIHTSRARRWQVLPGRTHPLMTDRGGAEGYVFTGWRAKPAEGRVSARGKFQPKRRKVETGSASEAATPTVETPKVETPVTA
ncbi:Gcd10p family-domain-containing protein [Diplogelasinospora grovesii]|uniref:tRNA (adenine(58)-N(1))-methyltransferase non-catalytic subunit TRM6 n=1 Tax=Diplogelasinospora grovesii TaxID=303347 RepID=A0AAN6S2D8_9PEZI|nr:Gcd10p family-domain-containing protein [Diplogelasinospora grovesii]